MHISQRCLFGFRDTCTGRLKDVKDGNRRNGRVKRVKFKCKFKRCQRPEWFRDTFIDCSFPQEMLQQAATSTSLICAEIIRKWELICIECRNDVEFCSQMSSVIISYSQRLGLGWLVLGLLLGLRRLGWLGLGRLVLGLSSSKNVKFPAQQLLW